MNTITHANGEILTGKRWRKEHSSFLNLPFYSTIPQMDEMAGPLRGILSQDGQLGCFHSLLVKFCKGLDDVHPFSDTPAVDVIIREAEMILSPDWNSVGPKHASRIWGFMSKFVMLDRFAKTLGVAEVYPGVPVPKKMIPVDHLGTASKLLDELNPPTKVLGKFLKAWGDRKKARSQYSQIPASNQGQDLAGITLTLSRRLSTLAKVKNVLNIEAGLEMMALAMAISSENSGVFPEFPIDLKNVLWGIWSDRMDPEQFEEISLDMQVLHKSMKNLIEMVFATSPLLALSTSGWHSKSYHGAYLLKVFIALGNDRPQVLVGLEDQVLHAAIGISEGKSREDVMDALYSQISTAVKDLGDDDRALKWFNVTMAASSIVSTPAPSERPSTPLLAIPNVFKGGLASPPESRYDSPHKPAAHSSSSSALPLAPPRSLSNGDLHDARDSYGDDEHEFGAPDTLGEEGVGQPSLCSPLTDMPEESDDKPPAAVRSAVESGPMIGVEHSSEDEEEGDPMVGVGLKMPLSEEDEEDESTTSLSEEDEEDESTEEEGEDDPMNGVSSDSVEDGGEGDQKLSEEEGEDDPMNGVWGEGTQEREWESMKTQEVNQISADLALAAQLAQVQLRRSSRNAVKNKPNLKFATPHKSSNARTKRAVKKDAIVVLDDFEDEGPNLSHVELAMFHRTLYADIAGWGSTIEAGAKPYRHVPVEIVPPGNVASTGDDTDTLRKVETLIQAEFQDGVPPHLLPNARSFTYVPGSHQSRIFVSSHSEFSSFDATQIQAILRDRLILVHGHVLDYNYGWDLPSFGRLYDVDKKVSVQVSNLVHPHKPELRHHQGTLREFHKMTSLDQEFPPLNAISLPAHQRNLHVPCQFGSFASHEVAQSRLPSEYEATFNVPDLKSKLEWSLIGGRGAISPFHIDSDGLGTVVVVLEGSKYWVVATRVEEHDSICTADSLGPDWNPYYINDGDKIERFRFEAVHLQKGDMLVMPPGVPHWVLSTSNAICIGRHFYSASTISLSILGIVHTFILGGAVTNEDHLETRMLLYQLLVFWSRRIDKTDVDGAHIPVLSSKEGFFDLLYLGIFAILSPAFDGRFYSKPPPTLVNEAAYAIRHFHSLIHVFSLRFIILLGGEAVAVSYVRDRMLAEFAAAAVVFARAVPNPLGEGNSIGITFPKFLANIEGILENSCPDALPFFSSLAANRHKHFLWTGPDIEILPRSDDIVSMVALATKGELLDFPGCPIYSIDVDDAPSAPMPLVGKRHGPDDGMDVVDEQPKKRKLR